MLISVVVIKPVCMNSCSVSDFATRITCNLFNAGCTHVKQHAAVDDAAPQLKQTVQRKSGHVGFAPPLATVLHVFFKLQPSVREKR